MNCITSSPVCIQAFIHVTNFLRNELPSFAVNEHPLCFVAYIPSPHWSTSVRLVTLLAAMARLYLSGGERAAAALVPVGDLTCRRRALFWKTLEIDYKTHGQ